ncbi:MAG: NPCBM/NEW2 domain-containing protein [Deltaproteobacteria bacterium]|nr:NPCBM/NEW2 domain-containing protein [Deltaproteobacteria bacterium]
MSHAQITARTDRRVDSLSARPSALLSTLIAIVCMTFGLASPASAVFNYSVYTGQFTSVANLAGLTPVATGTSSSIKLGVTSIQADFGLVFTNTLNVTSAGVYEFQLTSDEGSKLFIDGVLVVNNDGEHVAVTVTGSRNLTAGSHTLRVEYFDNTGAEFLEARYRKQGLPYWEQIPTDGQLRYTTTAPAAIGSWGPIIPWPEIAISVAVLPDGRILSWASYDINEFRSAGPTFTHASVFDPTTQTFVPVDNNFHDMFCAGVSTLENGTIIASGGNPSDRRTSAFNPATLSFSPLTNMIDLRWYSVNATLPNNTVFASFALDAGNRTEVYNPTSNTWAPRANVNVQTQVTEQNTINAAFNPTNALPLEWLSHIQVTPQGDVLQAGPTPTWHRYDPLGGSPSVVLGQPVGDFARSYGNAVNYDAGKILLVGGADPRLDPPVSTAFAYRIDVNGPSPVVTPAAAMNYPRALSNTVTLPNGKLIVIGGNRVARQFDDTDSNMAAEIYDPATDIWQVVDDIDVPRNYHSTALLMKDGRVLSAGGGACSGCPADHLDGQIYTPAYLYESDGSPAVRPTLSVPTGTKIRAGDPLTVTAGPGTTSFSVVRLSATTHHMNTDQRYLPIPAVDNGNGTRTLSFPSNPNVLIVGNYFVFALDADGTPSIGQTIQVVRDVQSVPEPTAVYVSDLPWTASTNDFGPVERDQANGGVAAGDGPPLRLGGVTYPKGVGIAAYSEITLNLGQQYDRFRSFIGLDDSRDGLCGRVQFEVLLDGVVNYTSGAFVSTTATGSIDIPVGNANAMTLKVYRTGSTCTPSAHGDLGDWASARLIPKPDPGYRYYRFRPTKLRNDGTADSVQVAELALFETGVRKQAIVVTNPGGNNPTGQGPAKADDATTSTKWRDYNKGYLIYDMGANVEIDAYTITTANDASERDPVRWSLEASIDGVTWDILDDKTSADYPTPTARLTTTPSIPLTPLSPITPLPAVPRHSTTLLVETSSGADRIWNVNPDNDTVTVSSAAGAVLAEIPVGDRPWSIARRPGQSRIYVVNKGSASISVINASTFAIDHTVALPRGAEPHGLVFSSDGATYYLVLEATATLQKRTAATDALVASLPLTGRPRHLSISPDDAKLLVSNFITPPLSGESTTTVNVATGGGQVFVVTPGSMTLASTVTLPFDTRAPAETQGPGLPNYVGPAVVSFAGSAAYVPTKKDNVRAGALRGVAGMSFDSTVRANTSRILLASNSEDATFRVDHDNASLATGAALTGDDRYLLVTLETSRELAVYDLQSGFQLMRLPTGRAPQSVALSTSGATAYVHNFMDRSISRFDLTQMLQTHLPATNILSPIPTVATETLSPTLLQGKQLFYDAQDDRLSLDNYMSCAACHNEGDSDGRVWDLGGFGEGVRNTIDLRGKGTGHGRPHWTGNFDEIQDFEGQIRGLNLGTGLLTNPQFSGTSNPLGAPKAGLSPDLDALAAYVDSLTSEPRSPFRPSAGAMSATAVLGRAAFVSNGCLGCHSVAKLTDSPTTVRHDVGTIDAASGQRLGATLDGFDTPGLLGVWASPPHLHDGSATTLEAAIAAHSAFSGLSTTTKNQLAAFLREAETGDLVPLFDDDDDGTVNLNDAAPTNPCLPTAFVAACAQDTDGDGQTDFQEGATADGDGDGLPDYQESSTADADQDGVPDQSDPENGNACVPNAQACAPAVPTAFAPVQLLLAALLVATGATILKRRRRLG